MLNHLMEVSHGRGACDGELLGGFRFQEGVSRVLNMSSRIWACVLRLGRWRFEGLGVKPSPYK